MDIAKNVDQALTVLEKHIEPVAKHAFELMVRQNMIEGIVCTAMLLTLVILSCAGTVYFAKMNAKDDLYSELYFGLAVTSGIVLLCCVFAFVLMGGEPVLKIFNPEYYAIMDLVGIVK